jgi:hypothetical protein
VVVGQAEGGPRCDPSERRVGTEPDDLHADGSRVVAAGATFDRAEKALQVFNEVRHALIIADTPQ